MLGKVWAMLGDNKFEIGGVLVVVLIIALLLGIGYLGTIYAI